MLPCWVMIRKGAAEGSGADGGLRTNSWVSDASPVWSVRSVNTLSNCRSLWPDFPGPEYESSVKVGTLLRQRSANGRIKGGVSKPHASERLRLCASGGDHGPDVAGE